MHIFATFERLLVIIHFIELIPGFSSDRIGGMLCRMSEKLYFKSDQVNAGTDLTKLLEL
jgi:hypothetical protein